MIGLYQDSNFCDIIQGDMKGKRIALLGGRFDPPHWGHYWIGRQVLEHMPELGAVWFMPVSSHPWRKEVTPAVHRYAMTELMTAHDEQMIVSTVERDLGGVSYTIETLKWLVKHKPNTYYFILGSDGVSTFHEWEGAAEIVKLVTLVIVQRVGHPTTLTLPNSIVVPEDNLYLNNLSSTHLRERLANKLPIHGLVPPGVESYIHKHTLYT
jgi:nicotinate-nucleotide adenylyltransferase